MKRTKSSLRNALPPGWGWLSMGALLLLLPALALAQSEAATELPAAAANSPSGVGWLQMKVWSPYVAGAGIGILSWFAFLLSDHPLGISTALAKTSGLLEKAARGDRVLQRAYYQRFVPAIDWEWMLVAGLFSGAFLSASLSGDFVLNFLPPLWIERFGDNLFYRWLIAFVGGMLVGLGSRWANGCTSGHALSGTMQLVVSSWVAAIGIFAGGIVTALVMF